MIPTKELEVAKKKIIPAQHAQQSAKDQKIILLAKENPKRKRSESAKRFSRYVSGMRVSTALEKGITRSDLVWDKKHGFIKIV